MAKLISVETSNFQKCKYVSMKMDANGAMVVAGENANGKSSFLDSIWTALGGKISEVPVRKGEKNATIRLSLSADAVGGSPADEVVVTKVIKPDRSAELTIAGADGRPYLRPQSLLDLIRGVSFDPCEFAEADDTKLAATLRTITGIDFTALEAEKKRAYDERTMVGREVKTLEGQLAGLPLHPGVPRQEDSVVTLTAELTAANAANAANAKLRLASDNLANSINSISGEIRDAEAALKKLRDRREELGVLYEQAKDASNVSDVPTAEITARITACEETNKKVRANRQRMVVSTNLDGKKQRYAELSADLESIESEKAEILAAAKFPVPGLSFDESGMTTYNGIPFRQCSKAERYKISTAIGIAINPKLRLMRIMNGGLLGDKALAAIDAMARDGDYQLIVERCSTTDAGAIVLVDGEVDHVNPKVQP